MKKPSENQFFLMVQNHWKVLKNKHFSWFQVIQKNNEKTIPKGTSKVMFFDPKWRHGRPRFDLSFVFWCFAAMLKNHHFGTPSRWTNKSNKSSLGAPKGRKKVPDGSPGVSFLARRVPRAASRARTSEEKNDRGADEQLVRDLTRHGPMAWRIKHINV